MPKTQDKENPDKETPVKAKDRKRKDRKAMIGRVKKVIKKSRRRLSEEKFEKELRRTIVFLEQLQTAIGNSHAEKAVAKPSKKPAAKATPAKKAAAGAKK